MSILAKLKYCPWRTKGVNLFAASGDEKAPQCTSLLSSQRNKRGHKPWLRESPHLSPNGTLLLPSCVLLLLKMWQLGQITCVLERDPKQKLGKCSAVRNVWIPGWQWHSEQCHSGSIPQGQSRCFKREMKMALVTGLQVTSQHTTGEGGDLVCLWILAASEISNSLQSS